MPERGVCARRRRAGRIAPGRAQGYQGLPLSSEIRTPVGVRGIPAPLLGCDRAGTRSTPGVAALYPGLFPLHASGVWHRSKVRP